MFMTAKQAAERWGISDRRIRILCSEGKIPIDAEKPADGRYKSKESILARIDRKKKALDGRRALTEGKVARLNEELDSDSAPC